MTSDKTPQHIRIDERKHVEKALSELFGVHIPAINKHLKKYLPIRRAGGGFSYFHFGNNCW